MLIFGMFWAYLFARHKVYPNPSLRHTSQQLNLLIGDLFTLERESMPKVNVIDD